MVTVGQRGPLPHRKGRDSGEQHFTKQAHRQKNTHIKLLQNNNACESSLFTHIYARYFALKKKLYIYFAAKYECIELSAHSVIWIWWGSAPPAPNVETPLHIGKAHTVGSC